MQLLCSDDVVLCQVQGIWGCSVLFLTFLLFGLCVGADNFQPPH